MSDGPQKLPPKKEVAIALLEGPSMFVHLDPRRPGVLVPRRFLDKPQLVLQVGLNMVIPIPDLTVDEEGISCTLSFDRAPFWVRMPWVAIYALVGEDGRGMMWPTDIPPEVVTQMQNAATGGQSAKPQARPRPKLAAVAQPPPDAEKPSEEKAQPEAERAEAAAEPVLRVVKNPEKEAPAETTEAAPQADEPQADATAEVSQPKPAPGGSRKPKRELPSYLRVIK